MRLRRELAALTPRSSRRDPALGRRRGDRRRAGFRFGHDRAGDLELLEAARLRRRRVPLVGRLLDHDPRPARRGRRRAAAPLLGHPDELDGTVVPAPARSAARLPDRQPRRPARAARARDGIYAGFARGHRAAVSIGVNLHFGGGERRVEAYLVDFEGDLYGQRLVVELWEWLRDEAVFASEAELTDGDRRTTSSGPGRRRPV